MKNQDRIIKLKGHIVTITTMRNENHSFDITEVTQLEGNIRVLKGVSNIIKESAKGVTIEVSTGLFDTQFVIPNQAWDDAEIR